MAAAEDPPEVTHELELDDADIETELDVDIEADLEPEAEIEVDEPEGESGPPVVTEAPEDERAGVALEPEVMVGEDLDDDFGGDFEDSLEDVGDLPGSPTIPGASLAELEAARREALGESADDAPTPTEMDSASRGRRRRHAVHPMVGHATRSIATTAIAP